MRIFPGAWAALFAAGTMLGGPLAVTSYTSFADSPFAGGTYSYFYLEDFEDGSLNTPGVSANAGSVLAPSGTTDSVDADDGSIDGSGTGGHSYYVNTNSVRFTFSAAVLGSLPTVAGLVWTDVGFSDPNLGFGAVEFEAFDHLGVSLGIVAPGVLGDGDFKGQTAEDRFFGFTNAAGISAIEIRMPSSTDWEMDHLQYGYSAVPEPSTWALGMTAFAAAAVAKLRRR